MLKLAVPAIQDKEWIMALSEKSNLHSADFSYGSVFCWSDAIHPRAAMVGNRLVLRYEINGEIFYAYPVGGGDIRPALTAIREDAEGLDVPLKIRGITRDVLGEAMSFYEKRPEISMDERYSDYVYLIDELSSLSGKKYHAKKNHVNRFMADNDWSFEPITEKTLGECREMASHWFSAASEERGAGFDGEMKALGKTFDNYFELGFDGGIIRVGGKVAAFTIGEKISSDTFVTHFEKADPHQSGGYAIINQQFAVYLTEKYPSLIYVNREEDMGMENLRKAKRSYKPVFMADKYTAGWTF